MDITFYALVVLASAILLLAMWACSSHNVPQWGPDLTMELPAHLLQEVLFQKSTPAHYTVPETIPSAPSDTDGAPLLSTAKPKRPRCPPKPPPKPVIMKSQMVRVLPSQFVQQHGLRSTPQCFIYEKPV